MHIMDSNECISSLYITCAHRRIVHLYKQSWDHDCETRCIGKIATFDWPLFLDPLRTSSQLKNFPTICQMPPIVGLG